MAEGSASRLEHDLGPTGSGHVHTKRTRPGRRTALDARASGTASRPRAYRGAVPEQSKSGEERGRTLVSRPFGWSGDGHPTVLMESLILAQDKRWRRA